MVNAPMDTSVVERMWMALEGEIERVEREAEDIKSYVEEVRQRIRRGARTAPKRFHL